MRVLIWPAGNENDGTSQYRLYLPAAPLIADGADIRVDISGPSVLWADWPRELRNRAEPPPTAKVMGLAKRPEADVVVMQRPGRRWWADVIPFLREAGIRVVVDIDDHFRFIEKDNWAYDAFHGDSEVHDHLWVSEACKRADLVTTTTPVLADFYGFGHGRVLPNLVPASYLQIDARRAEHMVMWTGTVGTHPHDLQVTRGAIGAALKSSGWGFHVIGRPEGVQDALGLAEEPTATTWLPFADYPAAMAEATIGIVPLVDSVFNRGKSCLKMMEFASLGVPALATGTPDNRRLNGMGIGCIVKHPAQWERGIRRLIENQQYREDVAGHSKEVMKKHTYEKQSHRWAEAWGLK
jgi:hypothetical protein